MKITTVSAISVVGVIILPMTTNVCAMPSYKKDSYSKENSYEKAERSEKYPSSRYTGNGGYSGNRGYSGSRRHEKYGGKSFQGGYMEYPAFGYSGYNGFGGYSTIMKEVPGPIYPMYIPETFTALKKNTYNRSGKTSGIVAVAFIILLMKSGAFFQNKDSLFGLSNSERIFG
ncbi:hypothetical protein CHS0354_017731 [Potamilus streckersoni]|uniref:Uncharacterized protein n=1 Tax=Potamilus streckersoni TaxID=2493646 RepID=A0AAE0SI34_9BIVA|nr:hypothetical protein CHS0354_017731 [Potamilus streckersoni]